MKKKRFSVEQITAVLQRVAATATRRGADARPIRVPPPPCVDDLLECYQGEVDGKRRARKMGLLPGAPRTAKRR